MCKGRDKYYSLKLQDFAPPRTCGQSNAII
jgi:hypothetical protein